MHDMKPAMQPTDLLAPTDIFVPRHLGPEPNDVDEMVAAIGVDSLDALIDQAVP
ncbi:MAG: hypothetical protein D6790_10720, partial [Caldilineae bacterium]